MGARLKSSRSSESEGDGCSDDPGSACTSEPRIQIELNLNVDEPDPPIRGWLEFHLGDAARRAGVGECLLNIIVVDDAQMSALHQRYLGDPRTTDVLTFNLAPDPTQKWRLGDPIEGDLAICLDQAARQAAVRGHDTRVEVLLYAVHGLLHLLGMDDDNPQAAAAMHAREDELLSFIGIGPVFDDRNQRVKLNG